MRIKRAIIGACAASGALVLALAGCGSGGSASSSKSSDSSSSAKQEQTTKKADPKKEASVKVTIDGAQMATDYDGNPCVVVNYTFTNVSNKEAQSFTSSTYTEVYQNGVQCDAAATDAADGNSLLTNVQAGHSVQVQEAYSVKDTSDIEVKVYAVENMFDGKTPMAEQKISLS